MLTQLLYFSEVRDLGPGGAADVLEQSRRRNKIDFVTGVLLFNQNYFLQCLEGSRETVTAVFGSIAVDPRHGRVTLMSVRDIDERVFPDWSMGFVSSTTALRASLLRVSPTDRFEPAALSSTSAVALMTSLRQADGVVEIG
ncbi:MAG: BLUF domain-containing protein [Actinobacteria bacterium]|nr:BLUF domain-containing protein [Actinomycetota bacterium]